MVNKVGYAIGIVLAILAAAIIVSLAIKFLMFLWQ